MRISDWSSDVCSSDLVLVIGGHPVLQEVARLAGLLAPAAQGCAHFTLGAFWKIHRAGHGIDLGLDTDAAKVLRHCLGYLSVIDITVVGGRQRQLEAIGKIGRASCRERVCQYV